MKHTDRIAIRLGAVFLAGMLTSVTALAEPPPHAGNKGNKGGKPGIEKQHSDGRHDKGGQSDIRLKGGDVNVNLNAFFGSDDRRFIHDYYAGQFSGGHCPPGLAKKNNGCLPPGQAKKWRIGHPLPGDLIYHDVPHEILHHFGHIPAGNKLVRVGADILLIGIGTGMVVDAVEDLGGLF